MGWASARCISAFLTHLPGLERQAGACLPPGPGWGEGAWCTGGPRAWAAFPEPAVPISLDLPPPSLFPLRAKPVSPVPHPRCAHPAPSPTVPQMLASSVKGNGFLHASQILPGETPRSKIDVGCHITEERNLGTSANQLCPSGSEDNLTPSRVTAAGSCPDQEDQEQAGETSTDAHSNREQGHGLADGGGTHLLTEHLVADG